ncbi:MAG TPA: plastocyanin/azurin family copper-binding protein, partial [Nitrososphaera sp.]|nr:plastocyanin/azurin family copper-binding protein [Nitrososphaera sp.]
MVKKNAVVIASVVIAGAIVAMYVLSSNYGELRDLAAEGSGNSIQETTTIPSNSTVVKIVANAGSNSFSPNPVEVKVGEIVTWINNDSGRHTITSKDGTFDSGVMGKGQSFSFTFDKAGQYPYFCSPHPGMV